MKDEMMTEHKSKSAQQIRLEKLNASIQLLQAKKEELLHKRLVQIVSALKKSKALHLPDTLIVGVLNHAATLYDKNPSDPFLVSCVEKASSKESSAS